MTRRRSLGARLIAGTLLWLVVALGAGGLALSWAFQRAVESAFDDRLDALASVLAGALEATPDGGVVIALPLGEPRFERVFSGWYWQVDGAGRALLRSRSLWDATLTTPAGDAGWTGPRAEALRTLDREITIRGRSAPLRIVVAGDAGELQRERARFDRLLWLALGVLGAGLAAAVVVQVGFGLRPLRAMTRALARVHSGELTRLPADQPAEIAPLADAMNAVLDHDADLIERARTHVGNLAHALKTPLAILKAEADGLDPGQRARWSEPIAVIQGLLQHHLARAAAVGPARGTTARTDVAPVVHAVRDAVIRLHAARAIAIDTDVAAGLVFAGERQDLEEMLGTLTDNAGKWAAHRIVVDAHGTADGIRITVDDDGPGLPPGHEPQALERGVRLDDSAPGSGLGLAIARDLAALYGGSLALAAAPAGGLRATLTLPGRS